MMLSGKKLGMDDIVLAGSTVLAVVEQAQANLQLEAGGKWGNPQVSDGEVIKHVRQVRPQLEPHQVKALLGGSPKLAKFVQSNGYGQQLLDLVLHEEKRQGLVPKLGWQRDLAGGKPVEGQDGWQQVARKNKSKPKQLESPVPVKRTMQLQAAQVVCDGRPLPVREVLLHGYGGVCIVRTKEELVKLAKLHKADGRTPQVAVAATKYDLTEEEKRSLVQTPVETSLRFRIKEDGQENDKEATTRCCIYPLTAKQVHVVHAQEHSLALVDKEVMKVQVNPRVQCGKGVWVPKDGDLATIKKFVKQLAPEAYELVVESWKPKMLEGPSVLMKVKAANANKVASKLSEAGFSVTPSKAVQAGTKVAWTKAESLEEAVKLTKEVLKDLPATKQIQGTVIPWNREAALFIKGSTGNGGQPSFGIRLPPELHAIVQERLGRDARKIHLEVGRRGQVCRTRTLVHSCGKRPWQVDCSVGVGYERCTLRVEDLSLAKEHRLKAKEALKTPAPSRNDTWKTLLRALPLPADVEHAENSEQISTEAPWSAWDASAVQEEDSCSRASLDDEWCEEDDVMVDDWLEDEQQDRFDTRKRRANEQRQSRTYAGCRFEAGKCSTQEAARDPHEYSCGAKGRDRAHEARETFGQQLAQGAGLLPEQVAPMDDGEAVVEIFEGRQEAVTCMAASVFHSRKQQAAREGKSFQLARLHHGSTMQAARSESWGEDSGEGNLCFWRCISAILKYTRHPDQEKSALVLKQDVCNWGIMNATKASQQLECTPNGLLNDIRIAQRRGVMANEKCFALAALYYDLKLLIVDEDSAICWGLLPLAQGEDDV
eukprot:3926134-Amphidinium_carterae.1